MLRMKILHLFSNTVLLSFENKYFKHCYKISYNNIIKINKILVKFNKVIYIVGILTLLNYQKSNKKIIEA